MKTIFVDWYIKKSGNDGRRASNASYTISKIHKVKVPQGISKTLLRAAALRTVCHQEIGAFAQFMESEAGLIYRIEERGSPSVNANPPHLCKHCFKGTTL